MAVLGSNNLTLVDRLKSLGPSGDLLLTAEVLDQSNEILQHIPVMEGNMPTGNRTAVRMSLPTIYNKTFNKGTPSSKSTKSQMDERTSLYDGWSILDSDLAEVGTSVAEARLDEARSFLESMAQKVASDLFYGNEATNNTQYTGFAARYSNASSTVYGTHMIPGIGGSGQSDCTSIWLVGWGDRSVGAIYPKGTMAGLQRTDFGKVDDKDSNGDNWEVYKERFKWHMGLCIRDWRYVARYHSIDASQHTADYDTQDLLQGIVKMTHRVPRNRPGVNWRLYGSRSVGEWLHLTSLDKRNNVVTQENVNGMPLTTISGIPFHTLDCITHDEDSLN